MYLSILIPDSVMEVSLGETFGQRRPPLSEMIRNILQEYASGQIFKVLYYFNTICMVNMRLQSVQQLDLSL